MLNLTIQLPSHVSGDREKALDIPISPLCDRSHPGITKSQVLSEIKLHFGGM